MGQLLRKVWVYCRVGNGDGFTGDDGYGDFTSDKIFTGEIYLDTLSGGDILILRCFINFSSITHNYIFGGKTTSRRVSEMTEIIY